MREFFAKHGNSFQPQDAIDMLAHKVEKIRELVYQEDELHLEELRLLSEMIDDYVREVKGTGYQFQKKDYQDYSSNFNPFRMRNEYPMYENPRPGQGVQQGNQGQPGQGGQVGYHYTYPIYPFYQNRPNK